MYKRSYVHILYAYKSAANVDLIKMFLHTRRHNIDENDDGTVSYIKHSCKDLYDKNLPQIKKICLSHLSNETEKKNFLNSQLCSFTSLLGTTQTFSHYSLTFASTTLLALLDYVAQ